MATTYIIIGAVSLVVIGGLLLGRWICNIVDHPLVIDKFFHFEEDGSYLN